MRAGRALLAGLVLALAACANTSPEPRRMYFSEPVEVGSTGFLRAVSGTLNVPIRRGGAAELLVNGDQLLPALIEAIDAAEHSVHVATYVWEPGRMSDAVLGALERAAARGVAVRLLLDGHGARTLPASDLEPLEAAGGRVATFRPIRLGWLSRVNRRNHRRVFVVDGETGFTGGASIADSWLGDARHPGEWRDDLVRVSGAMARSLQAAFTELWVEATGEVPTGGGVYPERPEEDPAGETVTLHLSVVTSPASEHTPLRTLLWLSFAGARQRIWITNPYVVPHESLRAILGERARAGVDVRILTAGDQIDLPPVRWAARRHYEEMLEQGVRIYEYQPTLIHSKSFVVDGIWSLVGSANLDIRSAELNEENLLAIYDGDFAVRLEERFRADLRHAKEIELEAWRERGPFARARELFASLFEEHL